MVLYVQNSNFRSRIKSLCGSQTSPVVFASKGDFWTRITSFYGSQILPVILCMQNNMISTRNTSLYWFHPHLLFCAFKRATLGQELHVSMGPRPHLWLCACKTACLASELLVSMGPSPHLWCLDAKQRLLDQNNKSLWVPGITCRFVHAQ